MKKGMHNGSGLVVYGVLWDLNGKSNIHIYQCRMSFGGRRASGGKVSSTPTNQESRKPRFTWDNDEAN